MAGSSGCWIIISCLIYSHAAGFLTVLQPRWREKEGERIQFPSQALEMRKGLPAPRGVQRGPAWQISANAESKVRAAPTQKRALLQSVWLDTSRFHTMPNNRSTGLYLRHFRNISPHPPRTGLPFSTRHRFWTFLRTDEFLKLNW